MMMNKVVKNLLLLLFLYNIALANSTTSFDMVDQRILRHVAVVKPGDRPEMMMMGASHGGEVGSSTGSSSGQQGNHRGMIQPTKETNIHGSSNTSAVAARWDTGALLSSTLAHAAVTTSPSLVSNVNNTISNLSDSMLLWSQYVGRSRYVLEVDPQFVAKINPFWLQFDPPSAGEHYGLAAFYFLMMLFGVIGNALVIFMFNR
ncbi:hypothetical protein AND_004908 [Anopheles darlingi]|uniref:Uncharacterized protein n=1 Tax=Anopheles darlingi TaxID=43151 RepID=W5JKS6_ANODA|nr:hypothetical protein AND_004908 [Anopheles darlingi]